MVCLWVCVGVCAYRSIVVAVLAHGRVVSFYPAVALRHTHKGIVLRSHKVPRLAHQPLDQIAAWLCGRPFRERERERERERDASNKKERDSDSEKERFNIVVPHNDVAC